MVIRNPSEEDAMTPSERRLSRRSFLKRAGFGLAAPYFLTSNALGAPGKRPASDRVVAGAIGVGGRGMGLLGIHGDPRCTIAAVCDVDATRLARAKKRIGKCDAYGDFRRIIDRKDLDAILTATPDHWHAPITIMACQSGKDVYCEKPLMKTVLEGREMVKAARRHGRVVQMGTQYRSMARVRQVCEWLRNGRIGKVHAVRLSHAPNRKHRREPGRQPPPALDWDLWLGPAPWAPYHPRRCHFSFRFWMDYGGGFIADNGVHMFGLVSWAMGTDATGPVTVEATGREDPDNLYDVPVEMSVRYQFADPPFVMTWDQPGVGGLNIQFVGSQATLSGFVGYKVIKGQADLSPTRPDELHLHRSDSHSGNWLECIATRERPACDVEIGHRVTCFSHLGNIAYALGRKLRWDPAAERFIGDDEANRMLHTPYREPWHL
jgi:predicted dehydrogenase